MRSLYVILASACAAGGSPPDPTDSGSPATTADTACVDEVYERGASTPEGRTLPCQPGDQVLGTVTDQSGAPVAGAVVSVCQEICVTIVSAEDGSFCAEEIPDGWHALKVAPPRCTSGFATAHTPVIYEAGESRTFPMVLPPLGDAVDLPASADEREVAPGLFVTAGSGQLTAVFRDPAETLAGARLADAEHPVVDLDGTVVDVWYLYPFEFEAKPAMPVRFANDRSLPDGTELVVYNGSYDAQRWLEVGTVTAQGAWLEGDAALSVSSTVVLLEPPPPVD